MFGDDYFARDNGSLSDRCPLSDPRPLPYDGALNATALIDGCIFKQYRVAHHGAILHLDLWRKDRVRSHFGVAPNDTTTTYVGRLFDIDCGRDVFPRIRQQMLASFQHVHVRRHIVFDLSNIVPETIMPPSPKLHSTRQDREDLPFKAYRPSFRNHSDHTLVQDVNSRIYPSRTLSLLRFFVETYDPITRVKCNQTVRPSIAYPENSDRRLRTAHQMRSREPLEIDIAYNIPVDDNHRFLTGDHTRCQSQGPPGSQWGLFNGQHHPIPHLPRRHLHPELV